MRITLAVAHGLLLAVAFAGAANAVSVMAAMASAATSFDAFCPNVFCIVPILQNEC